MSKRRVSNGLGRYVPHPPSPHVGGHYELEMVPMPPDVVRIVEEQPVYGFDPRNPRRRMVVDVEIRERFEVLCACVHCKEDLHFAFPISRVTARFPEEVTQAASKAADTVIVAALRRIREEKRQQDAADNFVLAMEEFYADR